MLKHIGPRELVAALGLLSIGAGIAQLSVAAALIVVGLVLFALAVPPRQFLR